MNYEGIALTIAGSDSSGGAGIQADLKTFAAFNVYGASVITSITAQNTKEVTAIFDIPPTMVEKQMDAVLNDIYVDAVKIGMLSNKEIIRIVSKKLIEYRIEKTVIDPVMVSKSGSILLKSDAIKSFIKNILPLSFIITPNIPEAEVLSKKKIETEKDMEEAAKKIKEIGAKYVLIKGGHLNQSVCIDILFDGKKFQKFDSIKIQTKNTHGTGCTFSSAITAGIAKGKDIYSSVRDAKKYITAAIESSPSNIGHGFGPVYHNIRV